MKLLQPFCNLFWRRRENAAAVGVVFLIAFGNTISLSAHILILSAHALIVFENRISLSTRTLILSAHVLIAFENTISLFAHILIASTLPSDIACSPTVPGGDTPCVTAGDAQRANPWERDAQTSDAGSVAQYPLRLVWSFSLNAFSATLACTLP